MTWHHATDLTMTRSRMGDSTRVEDLDRGVMSEDQRREFNAKIKESFLRGTQSASYRKFWETRTTLPAYACRDTILQAVSNNQVVVISGATGCGKTTQVLHKLGSAFYLIG